MKHLITYLFLLLPVALSAQPLHFTHSAVVSNQVGLLSWNHLHDTSTYQLYRMFPDQEYYTPIATTVDTFYFDTLHRTLCADTVNYYVSSSSFTSPPVGIFYQDNVPTTPCSLRLCTVDTTLSQIVLSWYPSPDTDVMGYYICMGDPCLYYDTVWGRLNTSYLCHELLDDQHNPQCSFRILAFDSCFQASPLTPYYHNPRLVVSAQPCSRQLQCSWNRYINMPDSVGSYCLYYRLPGDSYWRTHCVGPDGPFIFDTLISDLSINHFRAFLAVTSGSDSLTAHSLIHEFHFQYGDTAEYLRITSLDYNAGVPSVTLNIEIDPQFMGRQCYIYRSTGTTDTYQQIAELTRSASQPEQYLSYTDLDINRAAGSYTYRIGTPDICGHWVKYSDTVQLLLPEVSSPAAFIPNAIIYGDPDNGHFCPQFLSPLADGYSLDIFNRLGTHLFHTTLISDCWDGTNPQGLPLPQGVYIYKVHCRHADGSDQIYTGTILLLR